jgi:hypothetical protein
VVQGSHGLVHAVHIMLSGLKKSNVKQPGPLNALADHVFSSRATDF